VEQQPPQGTCASLNQRMLPGTTALAIDGPAAARREPKIGSACRGGAPADGLNQHTRRLAARLY
jgi:hypothetical protein